MSQKSENEPSIHEVVERIGFGLAQVRYFLFGGSIYLADGSELLLISAITEALAGDWSLTAFERGFVVTIVYSGILCGNLLAGPIGDTYGRRICILWGYAMIFICSMASSMAQNYLQVCLLRFIVGLGMGVGVPAYNTLGCEVTPKNYRLIMQICGQSTFTLGEAYCALLILQDDPDMKNLHWRSLVRLASIPAAVLFVAAAIWLQESPSYLAMHGLEKEAKEVLTSNARCNSVADVEVNFKTVQLPEPSGLVLFDCVHLFNRHFLSSTLVCMYTCFMCNLSFYGLIYAAPQILPTLNSGTSAALQLLIGSLWGIPGYLLGIFFFAHLPRKLVLKCSIIVSAISVFLFVAGTTLSASRSADAAWHAGYYSCKCFFVLTFCTTYAYISEIYPTSLRTTGCALSVAAGRIGAMINPLLYEFMYATTGSHSLFFYTVACGLVINFLIIDFAPIEPMTEDITDTLQETEKLVLDIERSQPQGFHTS